jgi:hypothetical protein
MQRLPGHRGASTHRHLGTTLVDDHRHRVSDGKTKPVHIVMRDSLCEALLLYPDNNEYPKLRRGRVALKLVPEVIDVDAQLLTPHCQLSSLP